MTQQPGMARRGQVPLSAVAMSEGTQEHLGFGAKGFMIQGFSGLGLKGVMIQDLGD